MSKYEGKYNKQLKNLPEGYKIEITTREYPINKQCLDITLMKC